MIELVEKDGDHIFVIDGNSYPAIIVELKDQLVKGDEIETIRATELEGAKVLQSYTFENLLGASNVHLTYTLSIPKCFVFLHFQRDGESDSWRARGVVQPQLSSWLDHTVFMMY